MPEPSQFYDMSFPMAGISTLRAFSDATPDQLSNGDWGRITPSGINVRGYDAIAQRQRGGTRPGIAKYNPSAVVSGWNIQMLDTIVVTSASAKS